MRSEIVAAVVAAAAVLAGCGGQGDQTDAAARCLRNALANTALGEGGSNNNCADGTAVQASGSQMPQVTCTHQNGNQFVCSTSKLDFDPYHLSNQFYNVTFDGKSIVYQQTQ